MDIRNVIAETECFIELSTWLHPDTIPLLSKDIPSALTATKRSLYLPIAYVTHINSLINSTGQERINAKRAASIIQQYMKRKWIKPIQTAGVQTPREAILKLVNQLQRKQALSILSHDESCVRELQSHFREKQPNPIHYYTINSKGMLSPWVMEQIEVISLDSLDDLLPLTDEAEDLFPIDIHEEADHSVTPFPKAETQTNDSSLVEPTPQAQLEELIKTNPSLHQLFQQSPFLYQLICESTDRIQNWLDHPELADLFLNKPELISHFEQHPHLLIYLTPKADWTYICKLIHTYHQFQDQIQEVESRFQQLRQA